MEWVNIILRFDVSKRLPFMRPEQSEQTAHIHCPGIDTHNTKHNHHFQQVIEFLFRSETSFDSVYYTRYAFNGRRIL